MRTMHREIVSAVIFSQDGKLLMGRKNPKGGAVYADCWHIPGGGVEAGESKEEALIRELREEIGLELTPNDFVLVDDLGGDTAPRTLPSGETVLTEMKFNVYRVELPQNAADISLSLDDDLIDSYWFTLAEVPAVKLTPPSVTLFKRLGYL